MTTLMSANVVADRVLGEFKTPGRTWRRPTSRPVANSTEQEAKLNRNLRTQRPLM